ncbi:MAG: hypothetical protein JO212_09215 [Acetobacteraceae bacterium]|nr:hypothetical protein [Acetobacteraceae bacterium]
MARKSTIGANPLDAVVPSARPEPTTDQPAKAAKERVTFKLDAELIEHIRDAVYWTPGATMAALIERAMIDHLAKLERERGSKFPRRSGAVRTGRPIKEPR